MFTTCSPYVHRVHHSVHHKNYGEQKVNIKVNSLNPYGELRLRHHCVHHCVHHSVHHVHHKPYGEHYGEQPQSLRRTMIEAPLFTMFTINGNITLKNLTLSKGAYIQSACIYKDFQTAFMVNKPLFIPKKATKVQVRGLFTICSPCVHHKSMVNKVQVRRVHHKIHGEQKVNTVNTVNTQTISLTHKVSKIHNTTQRRMIVGTIKENRYHPLAKTLYDDKVWTWKHYEKAIAENNKKQDEYKRQIREHKGRLARSHVLGVEASSRVAGELARWEYLRRYDNFGDSLNIHYGIEESSDILKAYDKAKPALDRHKEAVRTEAHHDTVYPLFKALAELNNLLVKRKQDSKGGIITVNGVVRSDAWLNKLQRRLYECCMSVAHISNWNSYLKHGKVITPTHTFDSLYSKTHTLGA